MLLILLFFLLFLLFVLVFFMFLVTTLSKSTFIWRSKFIKGIALFEREYPEFVYDYENKKLYFTRFAFSHTKYTLTYILYVIGFEGLSNYVFSFRDWSDAVGFAEIYWSPLYHYTETYLFDCFRSIRKGTFCEDNFCLRVIFSIGLFCLSFLISIFLVNFSSEYLVYLRLLLLFLILILSCLVLYNKFKRLKSDQFVLTVWFYRVLKLVFLAIDFIPKLINNLVNLLINVSIFSYILISLEVNVSVINVLMIYIIFLSLWSIIIKVCNLLNLSIGYGLHETQSIFFIPTGSLLIYILYSFLWWLQFVYKAIRLRDISLIWRYVRIKFEAWKGKDLNINAFLQITQVDNASATLWYYVDIDEYSNFSVMHVYEKFEALLCYSFWAHTTVGISLVGVPKVDILPRQMGFRYKLELEEFVKMTRKLYELRGGNKSYDMEKVLILEEKGVDSEEKL